MGVATTAVIVALAILSGFSGRAVAQIRYTDNEGVTHWVDSLDQVPPGYRTGAAGQPTRSTPKRPSGGNAIGPGAAQRGELVGPACDAAIESLATRQGGTLTRFDVRRELGAACEQQLLSRGR